MVCCEKDWWRISVFHPFLPQGEVLLCNDVGHQRISMDEDGYAGLSFQSLGFAYLFIALNLIWKYFGRHLTMKATC